MWKIVYQTANRVILQELSRGLHPSPQYILSAGIYPEERACTHQLRVVWLRFSSIS